LTALHFLHIAKICNEATEDIPRTCIQFSSYILVYVTTILKSSYEGSCLVGYRKRWLVWSGGWSHCDLLSRQNEIIHDTVWNGLYADLPFSNHNKKFDKSYDSALKNQFYLMTDKH